MSSLSRIDKCLESDFLEEIPELLQQSVVGGTTFFHFKDIQIFSASDLSANLDLGDVDLSSVYALSYREMVVATDVKGWVPGPGLYNAYSPRYAQTTAPYLYFNSL